MKNKLCCIIFLLLIAFCFLPAVNAQTPTVEKVEPPNWWANMTISTVRVLLRGTNLQGACVSGERGLTASNVKISTNGHYLI